MADANRTQYVSFSGGLQAHLLDCGWRSDSLVSLQKVQAVVRASNLAVPCPMGGNSFSKFTPQSFKLDLSYSSLDLVDEMLAFQNIFVSAFWKAVPFAPSFKTKTHKKLKTSWKKKKHTCIVFARFYTAVSAVPPKTRSKMGSSAQMLHVSEITS